MGKKDILEILRKFRTVLEEKKIRVEQMILFGSWVNGIPHEGSDIDVVVISRDFNDKDEWARIKITSSAVYKLLAPIQVFALTPDEWLRGERNVCTFARNGEIIAD